MNCAQKLSSWRGWVMVSRIRRKPSRFSAMHNEKEFRQSHLNPEEEIVQYEVLYDMREDLRRS